MPDKAKVEGAAKEVEAQQASGDMKQENTSNGVGEKTDEKKDAAEASPAKTDALALLAQGKRHLFVKDYPSAVAALGDACAKLSEIFGELGDECGEAYFSYGRALLELSREESNVLVENETEESEEGDEEEDDEKESEEENSGDKANGSDEKAVDDKTADDKASSDKLAEDKASVDKLADDKVVDDKTADDKTVDDKSASGDKPADDKAVDDKTADDKAVDDKPADDKANDDKPAEEEDAEEEVNNLQLAWEIFELAKVIFHRQNNESKLAETYLYLGEVSLESENYSSAIDDMKKCLDIQKKILAEDNRDIAETLFQLGLACSYEHMFEESKAYYKQASDLLETRVNNLKSGCTPDDDNTKHPFYSVDKEIEEIKGILPEIKEKIDDVEDLKRETLKSMMELAMKGGSTNDGAGSSASAQNGAEKPAATNISHLIKKKRKPEEGADDACVKKPCTE